MVALIFLNKKTCLLASLFSGADGGNRTRDSVTNCTSFRLLTLTKVLPFVCLFLFSKNGTHFWNALFSVVIALIFLNKKTCLLASLFSGADGGNRTRDSVTNCTSFRLLTLTKVLPFVCLFLFSKNGTHFWNALFSVVIALIFLNKKTCLLASLFSGADGGNRTRDHHLTKTKTQ